MKPPPFRYLRPSGADEVLQLLAEHGDEAKVLAGGQSLVPLLNFRLARPAVLIDLAMVDELRGVRRDDGHLVIGAMTRQREAETSREVAGAAPLIPQALGWVGHLQIRNRGTVGGSIAHADPAAELTAVALALDAEMVVRSATGERVLAAADFFEGPFTTALAPDELLTEVRFGVLEGAKTAFLELARRSGDFAMAGVAAVNTGSAGTPDVRLAAIGVGGSATRLQAAEDAVRGREPTDEVLREAGEAASDAVDPPTDVHADSEYRKELLGVLVRRALRQVA
jgi:carbon-monoxide dehydrogenase medium subunit